MSWNPALRFRLIRTSWCSQTVFLRLNELTRISKNNQLQKTSTTKSGSEIFQPCHLFLCLKYSFVWLFCMRWVKCCEKKTRHAKFPHELGNQKGGFDLTQALLFHHNHSKHRKTIFSFFELVFGQEATAYVGIWNESCLKLPQLYKGNFFFVRTKKFNRI